MHIPQWISDIYIFQKNICRKKDKTKPHNAPFKMLKKAKIYRDIIWSAKHSLKHKNYRLIFRFFGFLLFRVLQSGWINLFCCCCRWEPLPWALLKVAWQNLKFKKQPGSRATKQYHYKNSLWECPSWNQKKKITDFMNLIVNPQSKNHTKF